jgi:hypothetical protein
MAIIPSATKELPQKVFVVAVKTPFQDINCCRILVALIYPLPFLLGGSEEGANQLRVVIYGGGGDSLLYLGATDFVTNVAGNLIQVKLAAVSIEQRKRWISSSSIAEILPLVQESSVLRRALEEQDAGLLFDSVWTLDPGNTGYRLPAVAAPRR